MPGAEKVMVPVHGPAAASVKAALTAMVAGVVPEAGDTEKKLPHEAVDVPVEKAVAPAVLDNWMLCPARGERVNVAGVATSEGLETTVSETGIDRLAFVTPSAVTVTDPE